MQWARFCDGDFGNPVSLTLRSVVDWTVTYRSTGKSVVCRGTGVTKEIFNAQNFRNVSFEQCFFARNPDLWIPHVAQSCVLCTGKTGRAFHPLALVLFSV